MQALKQTPSWQRPTLHSARPDAASAMAGLKVVTREQLIQVVANISDKGTNTVENWLRANLAYRRVVERDGLLRFRTTPIAQDSPNKIPLGWISSRLPSPPASESGRVNGRLVKMRVGAEEVWPLLAHDTCHSYFGVGYSTRQLEKLGKELTADLAIA